MLQTLHLENFKSFEHADLELGQLTLVVGTNASGKSNLRDALLAEIREKLIAQLIAGTGARLT